MTYVTVQTVVASRSGARGVQPRLRPGTGYGVGLNPGFVRPPPAANLNFRTFGGPGGVDRRTFAMLEQWRRANPYVSRSILSQWARFMPLLGPALSAYGYLDFLAEARERALREPDETLTPTGPGVARTLAGSSLIRFIGRWQYFGRQKGGIYPPDTTANVVVAPFGPQWQNLAVPRTLYGPGFKVAPAPAPYEEIYPWNGIWQTPFSQPGVSVYAYLMQAIMPGQMAALKTNPGRYWKPEEVYYYNTPRLNPISNISIQIGPTVTVRPNVPPVRPPPGIRDRKVTMPPGVSVALGLVTETLDFLDILYRSCGGLDWPSLSFEDKMRWLFLGGGLANFDMARFVNLFLAEQLSDAMIGLLARGSNRKFLDALRKYGDPDRVAGLLWGPAM